MLSGSFSLTGSSRWAFLLSMLHLVGAVAPLAVSAKRVSFQTPVQEKLVDGASPSQPANKKIGDQANLAPVGLNGSADENEATDNEGFLKSSVSETKFIAKDKLEGDASGAGKTVSIVGKKSSLGDKVLKEGSNKTVEVAPLALMETQGETEKKVEATVEAEKRQLADLWTATMGRNPDIQFVINKLQPTEDQNHAMANTMKALSAVLFGAMNAAPMIMPGGFTNPNPAMFMGMSSGTSLIQSLFVSRADKEAKKHAISQEQATILYKIVRDTADKLMGSYRDYKKDITSLERASVDLQDLQGMVAEARGNQDAAKQIEMEYTLRKARREIEKETVEVRRKRQELVDLAGDDAVASLDHELQEEREAIARLTGGQQETTADSTNSPFINPLSGTAVPQKTAGNPASQIH